LGKEVLEPFGGDGERGGQAAPLGVLAGVERLEVVGGELARDPPDVDVDVARRRGQVDLDADHVVPDEEAADLDALEVGEGAVAEHPRDVGVKVGEVLEVDVAGAREVDGEAAVASEREGGDGRGEDARGQAVLREELGEGRRTRRRRVTPTTSTSPGRATCRRPTGRR